MARMSDEGLALLKESEGCELEAYQDSVGVWTIGYGHTGPDVRQGLVITQTLADELLVQDLAMFEQGVEDMLTNPAHQPEFDALVDFAYNCGLNALRDSELLEHVNAGRHPEAVEEFGEWVYGDPNEPPLPGLVERREKEADLYRKGGRAGGH